MKKFLLENHLYNNIMRAAAKHVGSNDNRPILRGVYFEVEQDKAHECGEQMGVVG